MGFWNKIIKKNDPPKKIVEEVQTSPAKPIDSPCNASNYLIHVSRCDKMSITGWDMCAEHAKRWQDVPSDERT